MAARDWSAVCKVGQAAHRCCRVNFLSFHEESPAESGAGLAAWRAARPLIGGHPPWLPRRAAVAASGLARLGTPHLHAKISD